jgi:hypothetical protein
MPLTLIKRAAGLKSSLGEVKGRLRVTAQASVPKRFLSTFDHGRPRSAKAGQTQIRGQEFFVTADRGVTTDEVVTAPSKSKHLIFSLN